MAEHVKVRIRTTDPDGFGSESFWAIPVSATTVRVDNLLVNGVTSYGDLVEVDADGQVTAVLERHPRPTWGVAVLTDEATPDSPVRQMAIEAFSTAVLRAATARDLPKEGWTPGVVVVVAEEDTLDEVLAAALADPAIIEHLPVLREGSVEEDFYIVDLVCSPDDPVGAYGIDTAPEQPGPGPIEGFIWDPRSDPRAVAWAHQHAMPDYDASEILDAAATLVLTHRGMQDCVTRGDTVRPLFLAVNLRLTSTGRPPLTWTEGEEAAERGQ